jgi:PAS domain S-box-containing protein
MSGKDKDRNPTDYRELVELLPQTVFEIDDKGHFTFANRSGFRTFGYRPEDLKGPVSAMTFFAPEDRSRLDRNIRRILRGEAAVGGEYTAIRKDGSTLPVVVSANAIIADGKPAGLRGVILDVSEIRRSRDLLRKTEERYRQLLETMNEGFAIVDAQTVISYVNIRLCEMLGFTQEEMVGERVDAFLDRKNRSILQENYRRRRRGGSDSYELTWTRKDGTFVATIMSPKPLYDDAGKFNGSYSVITDVTLLKQTETALRHREQELEAKTQHLEEANAALRVLLKRREEDKREFEERIMANMRELVTPYIGKLKRSRLSERQRAFVEILESHLGDLTASFVDTLSRTFQKLTPAEIRVATLVREGKSTKQIADMLALSPRTIEFHRENIRQKLGLARQKTNLRSFLLSLR